MREIKHLSVHQWLRSAIPDSQQPISPIGFLFLKLPPPPCAVLLVIIITARLKSERQDLRDYCRAPGLALHFLQLKFLDFPRVDHDLPPVAVAVEP